MRAAFPLAPDEADTEVREDGVATHWLSQEIWEGRYPALDSLSPNGRVLDEEMFDAVDIYHNVLREPEWTDGETYCEKTQDCSIIYPGMAGTPDAFTVARRPTGRWRLRVADLKYGFRFVEVWNNWQLIIYAVAIAAAFNLPMDTEIELAIIQPRSYHRAGPVRKWNTTLAELQPLVVLLQEAAQRAMGPNPMCVINPGCRDCAGRHACTTLQNGALVELDTADTALPLELTVEALADEMRRMEYAQQKIKARLSGLQTQAETLIKRGKIVPGYEMAPTFARERWRDGAAEVIAGLGTLYNAKTTEPRVVSPAAARRAGIPSSIVAMFAHKPSTGVRLQQSDPDAARKVFTPLPHKE